MFDHLISPEQKGRPRTVRGISSPTACPPNSCVTMDADKVQFPREFLQEGSPS